MSLLSDRAHVCGLPNASSVGQVLLELAGSEGFQGVSKILNIYADIPGRMACGDCIFLEHVSFLLIGFTVLPAIILVLPTSEQPVLRKSERCLV